MEGGVRWKEGADTCVFKPSVACKDDPAYPANIPGMVSRFVTKDARDIEIEKQLNKNYMPLIERGFVSAYSKLCTPQFSASNLDFTTMTLHPKKDGPCLTTSSRNLDNLITREYDGTYEEYFNKQRREKGMSFKIEDAIKALRGAIFASIALVPDNGLWIIHMDLHYNNILVKGKTSALADWGRAIVINSSSPYSIFFGLHDYLLWARNEYKRYFPRKEKHEITFKDLGDLLAPRLLQHSQYVFYCIHDLYESLVDLPALSLAPYEYKMLPSGEVIDIRNKTTVASISKEGLRALRGTMLHAIMIRVFSLYGRDFEFSDFLKNLLVTKNQTKLISLINNLIRVPQGFFNYALLAPPPPPTTQASNALGAGATTTTTTTKAANVSQQVKDYVEDLKKRPEEVDLFLLLSDKELEDLGYIGQGLKNIKKAVAIVKASQQGGRRKKTRKHKGKRRKATRRH